MTHEEIMTEIRAMGIDNKILLVEEIWDTISSSPDAVPVPKWHIDKLNLRKIDPGNGRDWNDIKAELGLS